jgi:GTP-binding protein
VGLGHAFLRHIERTKIIVHLLDLFPMDGSDPAANYQIIRKELEAFSPNLAAKAEIVCANKIDLAVDDSALAKLRRDLPGVEIHAISGATHKGVAEVMELLWQAVNTKT